MSNDRDETVTLSDGRLALAIDRLGGLEEIHRSTYAEFFDDAEILANAARELLARRSPVSEARVTVKALEDIAAMTNIERLESVYQFECEAGPLKNCAEWRSLKSGIETAVAALSKVKAEFSASGKPAGWVASIYLDAALAALTQPDTGGVNG